MSGRGGGCWCLCVWDGLGVLGHGKGEFADEHSGTDTGVGVYEDENAGEKARWKTP